MRHVVSPTRRWAWEYLGSRSMPPPLLEDGAYEEVEATTAPGGAASERKDADDAHGAAVLDEVFDEVLARRMAWRVRI